MSRPLEGPQKLQTAKESAVIRSSQIISTLNEEAANERAKERVET